MLRYEQRAPYCQNSAAKFLLNLMAEKETNLAVSLDVTRQAELLQLADLLGPEICVLKTHVDILQDFEATMIPALKALANKHRFLIFEDRKFADIGNTVKLQYQKGIYQIATWANITNAHTVPGPSIIEGLKQVGLPLGNGLLLLAEMSSEGSLARGDYQEATLKMALNHRDFVIGFITQHKLSEDPSFIYMTPGIQIEQSKDDLGQRYVTPEQAIQAQGTDIIIVGRGIYQHDDPLAMAKTYRDLGWQAYLARLNE